MGQWRVSFTSKSSLLNALIFYIHYFFLPAGSASSTVGATTWEYNACSSVEVVYGTSVSSLHTSSPPCEQQSTHHLRLPGCLRSAYTWYEVSCSLHRPTHYCSFSTCAWLVHFSTAYLICSPNREYSSHSIAAVLSLSALGCQII